MEDPLSGAGIDLAVKRMVSPLRRKAFLTSTPGHRSGENGSAFNALDEEMKSSGSHLGPAIQSTEEIELEGMSSRELSFQLWPIVKDSSVRPARKVKVMLDWTDKEHELYDSSYLKDLPEVHKARGYLPIFMSGCISKRGALRP